VDAAIRMIEEDMSNGNVIKPLKCNHPLSETGGANRRTARFTGKGIGGGMEIDEPRINWTFNEGVSEWTHSVTGNKLVQNKEWNPIQFSRALFHFLTMFPALSVYKGGYLIGTTNDICEKLRYNLDSVDFPNRG
jgi:hypothetical protein